MNTEQNNNVNNNVNGVNQSNVNVQNTAPENTKFCKFCGERIPMESVVCTKCGRQVEELKKSGGEQIIINNNATANATATAVNEDYVYYGQPKNKWVALLLCFFLGYFGVHKFYEGKVGMGILYIFTFGLFGVGIIIDFIVLLFKPNPYYV